MSRYRPSAFGRYGSKDRLLQRQIAFEKTSLSSHPVNVYRYLGSEVNGDNADIFDIQDPVLMETNDRAYDPNPVMINAHVEQLTESPFDLSKFGIVSPMQDVQIFKFHVDSFAADGLGRFIRVGDVIEVPLMEAEDSGTRAFFLVDDVDRKPMFENFYVTVTASPIKDTQEMEGIPDYVSNSDVLEQIDTALVEDSESQVPFDGIIAEPDLYVLRGYVDDDYVDPVDQITYANEDPLEPYDPRPDDGASFLDDPNAKIF